MKVQPWYATNARELLDRRKRGEVPTRPVSVMLTRNDGERPVLYLREDMPIERMDWRMLVNLDVWLWADSTVALDRIKRVATDIAAVLPKLLILRFASPDEQVHDVEIGFGSHMPGYPEHGITPEHRFTWCPLNLTGSSTGSRLSNALT